MGPAEGPSSGRRSVLAPRVHSCGPRLGLGAAWSGRPVGPGAAWSGRCTLNVHFSGFTPEGAADPLLSRFVGLEGLGFGTGMPRHAWPGEDGGAGDWTTTARERRGKCTYGVHPAGERLRAARAAPSDDDSARMPIGTARTSRLRRLGPLGATSDACRHRRGKGPPAPANWGLTRHPRGLEWPASGEKWGIVGIHRETPDPQPRSHHQRPRTGTPKPRLV